MRTILQNVAFGWVLGWGILFSSEPGSAAERYVIVPQESHFQFQAYSWLAQPLGTFHSFAGEIVADAQHLSTSRVHFVIEAASIDTGNARRDGHLRSADFLAVLQYPTISFVSTAVTPDGLGYAVQGDVQIRGVTKRITIPITVEQRHDEVVVWGSISLNRQDFGVNGNAWFNPVSDRVDITFRIVGVTPAASNCVDNAAPRGGGG